jgi:hypothetical protein
VDRAPRIDAPMMTPAELTTISRIRIGIMNQSGRTDAGAMWKTWVIA